MAVPPFNQNAAALAGCVSVYLAGVALANKRLGSNTRQFDGAIVLAGVLLILSGGGILAAFGTQSAQPLWRNDFDDLVARFGLPALTGFAPGVLLLLSVLGADDRVATRVVHFLVAAVFGLHQCSHLFFLIPTPYVCQWYMETHANTASLIPIAEAPVVCYGIWFHIVSSLVLGFTIFSSLCWPAASPLHRTWWACRVAFGGMALLHLPMWIPAILKEGGLHVVEYYWHFAPSFVWSAVLWVLVSHAVPTGTAAQKSDSARAAGWALV